MISHAAQKLASAHSLPLYSFSCLTTVSPKSVRAETYSGLYRPSRSAPQPAARSDLYYLLNQPSTLLSLPDPSISTNKRQYLQTLPPVLPSAPRPRATIHLTTATQPLHPSTGSSLHIYAPRPTQHPLPRGAQSETRIGAAGPFVLQVPASPLALVQQITA